MKKIPTITLSLIAVVAVVLIFIFTRYTHTFSEATCETASICECGEIQGEALGHNWTNATCETAKTCTVCGTIEGEPLEHNWLEADYENPKTCELCGLTEGEPLVKNNDTVFEEGEYIEESGDGPLTMDETLLKLKRMYENGEISKEFYEELIEAAEGMDDSLIAPVKPTDPVNPIPGPELPDPDPEIPWEFGQGGEVPDYLKGNPFD